jgi:hypothetical protein
MSHGQYKNWNSRRSRELGLEIARRGRELSEMFEREPRPTSVEFNDRFLKRTQEFQALLAEWQQEASK